MTVQQPHGRWLWSCVLRRKRDSSGTLPAEQTSWRGHVDHTADYPVAVASEHVVTFHHPADTATHSPCGVLLDRVGGLVSAAQNVK